MSQRTSRRQKASKKFINGLSVDKSSISPLISDLTKLKTEMTELGRERVDE